MRPLEYHHYPDDGTARGVGGDDTRHRSLAKDHPVEHRRAFSAGASWFLGMMLLVAGSTVAMQGAVMIGLMVLIAGLATVAMAAVALMAEHP